MGNENIEQLFAQTLLGDYEDEQPWDAVCALRRIGSREVFERAAEWSRSSHSLVKARGIDVLAQLGKTVEHPTNSFPEESYSIISDLIQHESDPRPLTSAIAALGHLDAPRGIPLILGYARHSDSEIRFAVACALGSFPNDERSAEALLHLTKDPDADVRDWATFGLGVQGDLNSAEIRDALARRLDDTYEDTREEAIVGLAKRQDQRVLIPLLNKLKEPHVSYCVTEAACLMLGLERYREDWRSHHYAAALRERFGVAQE